MADFRPSLVFECSYSLVKIQNSSHSLGKIQKLGGPELSEEEASAMISFDLETLSSSIKIIYIKCIYNNIIYNIIYINI